MAAQSSIRAQLEESLGAAVRHMGAIGGGDINDAARLLLSDGRELFVKYNLSAPARMFATEASGLAFLAEAKSELAIPKVHACAEQFLVLELLEPKGGDQAERLGRGLAQLHGSTPECFGLDEDNFIGTLHQDNTPADDWVSFWRERRLLPQLSLPGARRAFDAQQRAIFDRLLDKLDELAGPPEAPARLHGDLWGGNWMATSHGPSIFDPAVYGGNREVDLAMMHLFGGFPARSFDAYEEAYPLSPGAAERVPLYQLYPLLVHLNLFGGGYGASAFRIAQRYV